MWVVDMGVATFWTPVPQPPGSGKACPRGGQNLSLVQGQCLGMIPRVCKHCQPQLPPLGGLQLGMASLQRPPTEIADPPSPAVEQTCLPVQTHGTNGLGFWVVWLSG